LTVFFRAAEMLGLPLENCAAVEDAAVGIEAIKAARMFAVGIGPGLVGADWILDSTAELDYTSLLERFRSHHARRASDGTPLAGPGDAASAG
jgi:beta-phosphoglucomutase